MALDCWSSQWIIRSFTPPPESLSMADLEIDAIAVETVARHHRSWLVKTRTLARE
jgi:hypothetical protein